MGSRTDLGHERHGFGEVASDFMGRQTEASHVAQFYESDEYLCGLVTDYLAAGLTAGEHLLVYASPQHRDVFRRSLEERGFEVDRAHAAGRLHFDDAGDALRRFMVDGMPDRERFDQVIAGAVGRARRAR